MERQKPRGIVLENINQLFFVEKQENF